VGYGHGFLRLKFRGDDPGVPDAAGTDLGVQYGKAIRPHLDVGGALVLHMPDRGLTRVSFRAASEPQFLRYDPGADTLTADLVLAVRYRALRLAAGAMLTASTGGDGVEATLPQDARGAHANGSADVALAYRLSPIVGAAIDLEPVAIAARFRGARSTRVAFDSTARVAFEDNPLNGSTTVRLSGEAGYEPLSVDLATRIGPFAGVRGFVGVKYQRWRDAPAPVAALALGLALGITPSELTGSVAPPHLRDTISPRAGIEYGPEGAFYSVRAGYAFEPSPVGPARGWLTIVDPPRHVLALGGGVDFGRPWGVGLRADAHGALHLLTKVEEQKPSLALPFARYDAEGRIVQLGATLTGDWR
jgi:hypothetical protein